MHDEHLYIGKKGGHKLNILAVCNPNLKFTYVVSKFPGSTNDSYIWSHCNLYHTFENDEICDGCFFEIVGFALSPFLLTPILHQQDEAIENYTRAHKRMKHCIEKVFWVTKQRFKCIHRTGGDVIYEPEKCCKISVACMVLHNMCTERNVPLDDENEEEEGDNEDDNKPQITCCIFFVLINGLANLF